MQADETLVASNSRGEVKVWSLPTSFNDWFRMPTSFGEGVVLASIMDSITPLELPSSDCCDGVISALQKKARNEVSEALSTLRQDVAAALLESKEGFMELFLGYVRCICHPNADAWTVFSIGGSLRRLAVKADRSVTQALTATLLNVMKGMADDSLASSQLKMTALITHFLPEAKDSGLKKLYGEPLWDEVTVFSKRGAANHLEAAVICDLILPQLGAGTMESYDAVAQLATKCRMRMPNWRTDCAVIETMVRLAIENPLLADTIIGTDDGDEPTVGKPTITKFLDSEHWQCRTLAFEALVFMASLGEFTIKATRILENASHEWHDAVVHFRHSAIEEWEMKVDGYSMEDDTDEGWLPTAEKLLEAAKSGEESAVGKVELGNSFTAGNPMAATSFLLRSCIECPNAELRMKLVKLTVAMLFCSTSEIYPPQMRKYWESLLRKMEGGKPELCLLRIVFESVAAAATTTAKDVAERAIYNESSDETLGASPKASKLVGCLLSTTHVMATAAAELMLFLALGCAESTVGEGVIRLTRFLKGERSAIPFCWPKVMSTTAFAAISKAFRFLFDDRVACVLLLRPSSKAGVDAEDEKTSDGVNSGFDSKFATDKKSLVATNALIEHIEKKDVLGAKQSLETLKTVDLKQLKNPLLPLSGLMRARIQMARDHELYKESVADLRRQIVLSVRNCRAKEVPLQKSKINEWIDELKKHVIAEGEAELQNEAVRSVQKELDILVTFLQRQVNFKQSSRRAGNFDFTEVKEYHKFDKVHSGTIYGMYFMPDGKQLISGGKDHKIKVWDVLRKEAVRTMEGHTNEINGVGVSPDNIHVCSAADDQTVRVWNTTTGLQTQELRHTEKVWSAEFSCTGRYIAAAAKSALRIWDTATWNVLHTLTDDSTSWRRIQFSPLDDEILAYAIDSRVSIVNARTGTQLHSLSGAHSSDIRAVRFSESGDFVACSCKDKTVSIWRVDTGARVRKIENAHTDWVNNVRWLAADSLIVTCSDDRHIKFWDVATGEKKHEIEGGFDGNTYSLTVSSDDSYLACGSSGSIRMWQMPGSMGDWYRVPDDYNVTLELSGATPPLESSTTEATALISPLITALEARKRLEAMRILLKLPLDDVSLFHGLVQCLCKPSIDGFMAVSIGSRLRRLATNASDELSAKMVATIAAAEDATIGFSKIGEIAKEQLQTVALIAHSANDAKQGEALHVFVDGEPNAERIKEILLFSEKAVVNHVESALLCDLFLEKMEGSEGFKALREFAERCRRYRDWRIDCVLVEALARFVLTPGKLSPEGRKQALVFSKREEIGVSFFLTASDSSNWQSRATATDFMAFVKAEMGSDFVVAAMRQFVPKMQHEWDYRVALSTCKAAEELELKLDELENDSEWFLKANALLVAVKSKPFDEAKARSHLKALETVPVLDNTMPFISFVLQSFLESKPSSDIRTAIANEAIRLMVSLRRRESGAQLIDEEMRRHWDVALGKDEEFDAVRIVMRSVSQSGISPLTTQLDAIKNEESSTNPGLISGLLSADSAKAVRCAKAVSHLCQFGVEMIKKTALAVVESSFPRILNDEVATILMPAAGDSFVADKTAMAECNALCEAVVAVDMSGMKSSLEKLSTVDLNTLKNPLLVVCALMRARFEVALNFHALFDGIGPLRRLIVLATRHCRKKALAIHLKIIDEWKQKMKKNMSMLEGAEGVEAETKELNILNGVIERLTEIATIMIDDGEEATFVDLKGHGGTIYGVAFSPDGRKLASGSKDHKIRIWNPHTQECIRTIEGHTNEINALQYSADNIHIVTTSDDKSLRVWNADTGECVKVLETEQAGWSAGFSCDGQMVAGAFKRMIRVWKMHTWEVLQTWTDDYASWRRLHFHPMKPLLGCSSEHAVRVYDCVNGEILQSMDGHSNDVRSVRFSPTGNLLASVSKDRSVRVWKWETGESESLWSGEHTDWTNNVRWLNGDAMVVSSSDDKKVVLWNQATGEVVRRLKGHSGNIYSLDISPDEAFVAAGSGSAVKLWTLPHSFGDWQRLSTDFGVTLEMSGATPPLDESKCTDAIQLAIGKRKRVSAMDMLKDMVEKASDEMSDSNLASVFSGLVKCLCHKGIDNWMAVFIGCALRRLVVGHATDEMNSRLVSTIAALLGVEHCVALAQLETVAIIAHFAPDAKDSELQTLYGGCSAEDLTKFIDRGAANFVEAGLLCDHIVSTKAPMEAVDAMWRFRARSLARNRHWRTDAIIIESLVHLALTGDAPLVAKSLKSSSADEPGVSYFLEAGDFEVRKVAADCLAYLAGCGKDEVSMTALGLIIPRLHMEGDERVMQVIITAMEEYNLPVSSFAEDRSALNWGSKLVNAVKAADETLAKAALKKLSEVTSMKNPRPLLGYVLRACVKAEESSAVSSELTALLVKDAIRVALCVTHPDGSTLSIPREMSRTWTEQLKVFKDTGKQQQVILKTVVARLTDDDDALRNCFTSTNAMTPGFAYFLELSDLTKVQETIEVIRYLLENGSDDVKDLCSDIVYKRYQKEESYESALKFTAMASEFFEEDIRALELSVALNRAVSDRLTDASAELLSVDLDGIRVEQLANPFVLLMSVLNARSFLFGMSEAVAVSVRKFTVSVRRHVRSHGIQIPKPQLHKWIHEAQRKLSTATADDFVFEQRDFEILVAIMSRMVKAIVSGVEESSDEIKCIMDLATHSGTVYGLSFSPDSTMLATGSKDKTIGIWDTSTRTLTRTITGHTNEINHVIFSPDSIHVSSCGDDKTVRIFNVHTSECVRTLSDFSSALWSTSWSADGSILAACAKNGIYFYDTRTWNRVRELTDSCTSWRRILFAPRGYNLAASVDSDIRIIDAQTGTVVKSLSGHTSDVRATRFSQGGDLLASVSKDKSVRVWKWKTGECIATLENHTDWSNNVRWLAGDSMLVSSSDDRKVNLWDLAQKKLVRSLEGHEGNIYSLDVSPDESVIAAGSGSKVKLWALPNSFAGWMRVEADFSITKELSGVCEPLKDETKCAALALKAIGSGSRKEAALELQVIGSKTARVVVPALVQCLKHPRIDGWSALCAGKLLRKVAIEIPLEMSTQMVATIVEAAEDLKEGVALAQLQTAALMAHCAPDTGDETEQKSLFGELQWDDIVLFAEKGAANFVEVSLLSDCILKSKQKDFVKLATLQTLAVRCRTRSRDWRSDCAVIEALATLALGCEESVRGSLLSDDSSEDRAKPTLAYFLRCSDWHSRAMAVDALAHLASTATCAERAAALLSGRARAEWHHKVSTQLHTAVDEWELKVDGFEDSALLKNGATLLQKTEAEDFEAATKVLGEIGKIKAMENPLPLLSSVIDAAIGCKDAALQRLLVTEVVRVSLTVGCTDGSNLSIPNELGVHFTEQLTKVKDSAKNVALTFLDGILKKMSTFKSFTGDGPTGDGPTGDRLTVPS